MTLHLLTSFSTFFRVSLLKVSCSILSLFQIYFEIFCISFRANFSLVLSFFIFFFFFFFFIFFFFYFFIYIFFFFFFLYKCHRPKLLLVLIVSNDTYCEDTTSHTYNFRLSILSSPPEGSTLVAIPEIYLKITYLNPLAL